MSPQVARNSAARTFFAELIKRDPQLDREWLRQWLNAITVEELKLVRRDLLADARRSAHWHGGEKPENSLVSVRQMLALLDKRISGEQT